MSNTLAKLSLIRPGGDAASARAERADEAQPLIDPPVLRMGPRFSAPRVLLIAEGCNPNMTSVPLEGFSHSKAIAEIADALVLTHVRNRADLTAAGWVEGKQFACIDTDRVDHAGGVVGPALLPLRAPDLETIRPAADRRRIRHRASVDPAQPDHPEPAGEQVPPDRRAVRRRPPERGRPLAQGV
jgi:hypothetical protein